MADTTDGIRAGAVDAAAEQDMHNGDRSLHIAIIGAGVSGLATAVQLCENPAIKNTIASITMFDSLPDVGGVLQQQRRNGYLFEGGAQGVLASRTRFVELALQSGLAPEMLGTPKGLRRFLILPGSNRLQGLGFDPWALISLSGRKTLFSVFGFLRICCDFFVRPKHTNQQETLFGFFERRFGTEAAQRIAIPMATGIWAGGARKLLVRHVFPRLCAMEARWGSVLGGALAAAFSRIFQRRLKPVDGVQTNPIPSELLTFSNGMRTFAQGLHGRARTLAESQGINFVTRLGRTVSALELVPNGRSNTLRSRHILTSVPTCGLGGAAEQSEFDVVFTSVPIWRAPLAISISQSETKSVSTEDLDAFVRQRFALLDETPSHGLVVVGIGGKDTSPPPQGFGALAPEASPDLLGVLYVHSLAPSHAPEGHFMYRVLLGGDRDPAFVERTDAACVAKAR